MGAWRQHPGRSALPGSQFQGRLPPAMPVGPARQRLGRLRSRLLRGRSQPPAEAAPAGGRPSAGSGRRGDGPLRRGPPAAPPLHGQEGARPPRPPTAQRGLAQRGGVRCGWAWRSSVRPGATQGCPVPRATIRHGLAWLEHGTARLWQHREPGHGSAACPLLPSPGCSHRTDIPPRCHPVSPDSRDGVTHGGAGGRRPGCSTGAAAAARTLPVGREGSTLPLPVFPQPPSPACAGSVGTRGSPAQHGEDTGCQSRVYG